MSIGAEEAERSYAAAVHTGQYSQQQQQQTPPRRVEVGLNQAPSPLTAYRSNSEHSDLHHGPSLSPSQLLRPAPLLLLTCGLVALCTANLVLGIGGLSG